LNPGGHGGGVMNGKTLVWGRGTDKKKKILKTEPRGGEKGVTCGGPKRRTVGEKRRGKKKLRRKKYTPKGSGIITDETRVGRYPKT